MNKILLQIWVGDADRQWLDVHYIDKSIKPLGAMKVIVPEGPDHPNALLDACIAFFPQHFGKCPSMGTVSAQMTGVTHLDFDSGRDKVPKEWWQLRREAWPLMKELCIFEAVLNPTAFSGDETT